MRAKTLDKILQQYGYNDCSYGKPISGYRNMSWPVYADGGILNLILYKNEPDIQETIHIANQVGDIISLAGLPARAKEDARILQLKASGQVRYCGLYNYLPGHTIPWEAYTMDHLKLLGKSMSDMHAALADSAINAPKITSVLGKQIERMEHYFNEEGVRRAMREKLGMECFSPVFTSFHELLLALDNAPGQQPLHMDFVRGNVLFEGKGESLHISGILDFEKAAMGHPIFDIARTLAFLLVDCKYKLEAKVRKYFLTSGYQKRGISPLNLLTIHGEPVLEKLINLSLVYDLYKFMLHNPYESLAGNEHFVRTRQLLIQRNVIQPVVQNTSLQRS